MSWQPIETAPKDGRYIVAARFGPGNEFKWVKHSHWLSASDIADAWDGDPDDFDAGWSDGVNEDDPCYPTHWMPLPEPPEQQP